MKQLRKLLALVLVLAAMTCAVVFAQAAGSEKVMSLWLDAPRSVSLSADEVEYSIKVKNTQKLATITVELELDAAHVTGEPWVDTPMGWTKISDYSAVENGKLRIGIVLSHLAGLTTDEATEIAVIHVENKGTNGLAINAVTDVNASCYLGEEEDFVHCNLKNRISRTMFGTGGSGGPMFYTFSQSSQLGLIEPWFLLSNLYVYHENGTILTAEEIENDFVDYGAYFVRRDDLDEVTEEAILNSDKAYLVTKADGATVKQGKNGAMISVSYDQGIYTYELDTTFCVLFYVESAEMGRKYDVIKERNLVQLANYVKNNQGYDESERAVCRRMVELYQAITAHRAKFDEIPELPIMTAPHIPTGMNFGDYRTNLSMRRTLNIVLIEPWGLQFNAYVDGEFADYGLLVGDRNNLAGLLTDKDTRLFSLSNGHATVETGATHETKISGVYNRGIYTYQMDRPLYTVFFVKDTNGEYWFSSLAGYNILELVQNQIPKSSTPASEKAVYEAMVNLNTDVRAHRAKFGLN